MALLEVPGPTPPSPWRKWVPKWLGCLVLFYLFFPLLFVSGAYSSNSANMLSGLGIISEHIMFATFAAAIGLVIAGPYLLYVIKSYSRRAIYLVGLPLMFVLSGVCGNTESMTLLFICSTLMGIMRVFLMLTTLFALLGTLAGVDVLAMLSAGGGGKPMEGMVTKQFIMQGVFYFIFLSIGQIGNYVTAIIAYNFQWQMVYWFVGAMILVGLLLVVVMMKPGDLRIGRSEAFPPVIPAIAAAAFFFSLSYILVYGKTYDWFDDRRIVIAGAVMLISAGSFLLINKRGDRSYVELSAFAVPSVVVASVFFTLVMIMNSSSSLISTFMGFSMKLDSVQSVAINNWQILGFFLAIVINITMQLKGAKPRWFIVVGFTFMTLSAVYMYFQYQASAEYGSMILPTVVRSIGMMMIYAFCGNYGMRQLNIGRQLGTWVFIMLTFRAALGPVGGAALYSNIINDRTQSYIERFASDSDASNAAISSGFQRTQLGAMMQGKSFTEATQLASVSAKGIVQVHALTATLKEVTGWTIWFGIGCILLALIFPFRKRTRTSFGGSIDSGP